MNWTEIICWVLPSSGLTSLIVAVTMRVKENRHACRRCLELQSEVYGFKRDNDMMEQVYRDQITAMDKRLQTIEAMRQEGPYR